MCVYMYTHTIYMYMYCKTLLVRVRRVELHVAFEILLKIQNRRIRSLA